MTEPDAGKTGESAAAAVSDHDLALDLYFEKGAWPDADGLERLAGEAVAAALAVCDAEIPENAELSVVFTDDATIRTLNAKWRNKDKATNVLSFPQDGGPILGDIVLAQETVAEEAGLANKPPEHHIAHLLIHGFLHILGYGHDDDETAMTMENLERAALAELGIADPYDSGLPQS